MTCFNLTLLKYNTSLYRNEKLGNCKLYILNGFFLLFIKLDCYYSMHIKVWSIVNQDTE